MLAALVAAGCGGGDRCSTECTPACAAGSVCSSDLPRDISATWQGVCLQRCARVDDCPSGLRCRSFSGSPDLVCASDTLPAFCPVPSQWTDDLLLYLSSCFDADTLAQSFASTINGSRGVELVACANGCETYKTQNGVTDSRCR